MSNIKYPISNINDAGRETRPQAVLTSLAGLASGRLAPDAIAAHLWPDIVALSGRHGLAPLLAYRLRETGIDLPGVDLDPLRQAAHRGAVRHIVLEAAQAQIETALREANIAAIWIKGLALAHTLYPDPTLRPMSDLDVLVSYLQREEALRTAQAAGYHFPHSDGTLFKAGDALLTHQVTHHYHLVGGPAQTVILEVHSRLLSISNDLLPLGEVAWFWEQTQLCVTSSIEFSTLNPTAHLLYLCAHAELQHSNLYLLRYLDLHLLVTHTPPDWTLLIERAAALRWMCAVESALQTCVEMFDTPVPSGVFEQLLARRPATEDTIRIEALKAKGSRWVRTYRILVALSPARRLRMIARIVFPPPAYMRVHYAVPLGRPVWPCYIHRWLDQLREIFYAVGHRRPRPNGGRSARSRAQPLDHTGD